MEKDKNFFQGHARFAEFRKSLGLTQQAAADKFGVTRVTWGQCERGNAMPSGEVLSELALLGADVNYILTGITGDAQALRDRKQARIENAINAGLDIEKVRAHEATHAPESIEAIVALLHQCKASDRAAVHALLSSIVIAQKNSAKQQA